MTRGRPPNVARAAAREAGTETYIGPECICGCTARYTSSGACIDCSIARGKLRYQNNRGHVRILDAARYQRRKQNAVS